MMRSLAFRMALSGRERHSSECGSPARLAPRRGAAQRPRVGRGRKRDLDADLTKLRSENQRLEGEVLRLKALHRVTQKAVCVRPAKVAKSKDGKPQQKRRVRKKSRGERVLATLKASAPEESDTCRGRALK